MARLDPDWLDRQYNNRARIPEHPQIFERWARASAMARDGMSRRLDVACGPGPDETLDLFPATRADAPVLVFIHGGWWRILSSKEFSLVARGPVAAAESEKPPEGGFCLSNQWWRGGGSNSRPSHCERDDLPAELPPHCARQFTKSAEAGHAPMAHPGIGG